MLSLYSSDDFNPSKVSFPISDKKWVTIEPSNRLYSILQSYIIANAVSNVSSHKMNVLPSKAAVDNHMGNLTFGRISLEMGYGECQFRSFDGDIYHALYQHIGKPVGSRCGVEVMTNLLIFTDGPMEALGKFFTQLIELSEKTEEGKFICYTWHIDHCYWREETKMNGRPMQSVVLPSELKERLVKDVNKFLSPSTKDFYHRNGIPYRRSYLFWGVPGTGKTSLVQALAGHFHRSVCFLLPTHPKMTDDSLRQAINQIPDNSIVVFEDIDSLFSVQRTNKVSNSSLTFSGLLNALDGISTANGQIFILTTNLRDDLDHALLRNGRVDLHVEFSYAVEEQMELMWKNFYPEADQLAGQFSAGLKKKLEEKGLKLTTATLQHFFVMQMDSTPEQALEQLDTIIADMLQNSSKAMLHAAKDTKKIAPRGKARKPTIVVKEEASESNEGSEQQSVSAEGKNEVQEGTRAAEEQKQDEKGGKRKKGRGRGRKLKEATKESEVEASKESDQSNNVL